MVLFYCSVFPISFPISIFLFFFFYLHPSSTGPKLWSYPWLLFRLKSHIWTKRKPSWLYLNNHKLITYLHGYCFGLNHIFLNFLFPELLQYPPDCTHYSTLLLPPTCFLNMAKRVSPKNMKPNRILFPYKPAKGPFIFNGISKTNTVQQLLHCSSMTPVLPYPFLLLQTRWLLTVLQTYLACFPLRTWHWLLLLPGIFFSMYLHALLFYQLAHFCSTITISTSSYLDH